MWNLATQITVHPLNHLLILLSLYFTLKSHVLITQQTQNQTLPNLIITGFLTGISASNFLYDKTFNIPNIFSPSLFFTFPMIFWISIHLNPKQLAALVGSLGLGLVPMLFLTSQSPTMQNFFPFSFTPSPTRYISEFHLNFFQ